MPEKSLSQARLARRFRAAVLGIPTGALPQVFDHLRRECRLRGATLDFRQFDSVSAVVEHLATIARLDLLLLDASVDVASVQAALGRVARASPALLAGCRLEVLREEAWWPTESVGQRRCRHRLVAKGRARILVTGRPG